MRKWAPLTRFTLRRITASIMKDLILFYCAIWLYMNVLHHLLFGTVYLIRGADDLYWSWKSVFELDEMNDDGIMTVNWKKIGIA